MTSLCPPSFHRNDFYQSFYALIVQFAHKDRYRYWTGILIVLFSSISNTNTVAAGLQLNLLLLILSSSTLIGLSTTLKPYKTRLLNGLELFYLVLMLIFSTSNLYISSIGAGDESRANICFLVFFGICVGHIW